jgi:hypothetical protein
VLRNLRSSAAGARARPPGPTGISMLVSPNACPGRAFVGYGSAAPPRPRGIVLRQWAPASNSYAVEPPRPQNADCQWRSSASAKGPQRLYTSGTSDTGRLQALSVQLELQSVTLPQRRRGCAHGEVRRAIRVGEQGLGETPSETDRVSAVVNRGLGLEPVESARDALTWPARLCRFIKAVRFGDLGQPYTCKTGPWERKAILDRTFFVWRMRGAVCMKRSVLTRVKSALRIQNRRGFKFTNLLS